MAKGSWLWLNWLWQIKPWGPQVPPDQGVKPFQHPLPGADRWSCCFPATQVQWIPKLNMSSKLNSTTECESQAVNCKFRPLCHLWCTLTTLVTRPLLSLTNASLARKDAGPACWGFETSVKAGILILRFFCTNLHPTAHHSSMCVPWHIYRFREPTWVGLPPLSYFQVAQGLKLRPLLLCCLSRWAQRRTQL